MTQAELARRAHVTQAMICQIERGTKSVSIGLGREIAEALNCTIVELLRD